MANIPVKGGEAVEQERKWIREIQRRGSREAADRLIRVYYDEIYRQTGNKEDAMDLTQSIFIAVLRAIPSYQPEKASFRTWIYRIAANKVIDARRKNRPSFLPLEEVALPAEEDFIQRIHDHLFEFWRVSFVWYALWHRKTHHFLAPSIIAYLSNK